MKKYPHGLTLNAVCAAIEDYQRHEDSLPEEGMLAAFNTLLGHSDIAEAFRALERTADVNMAAAQAMRDEMYRERQRAEAAEAKVDEMNTGILALIPDCRYMDPPDGGDVTPLEQLSRMVAELRSAPAVSLAELVPDELMREVWKQLFMDENYQDTFRSGFSACRAAILRKIEEAK